MVWALDLKSLKKTRTLFSLKAQRIYSLKPCSGRVMEMENNIKISTREIKRYQTAKPLQYFNLINSYSAAELLNQQVVSSSLCFYYHDDCKEKDRGLLFLYLNEKNIVTETACRAVPQELR